MKVRVIVLVDEEIIIGRIKKLDRAHRENMKGDIYQSPRGGFFMIVEVKSGGAAVMQGVRKDRNNGWWETTVRFTIDPGWQLRWRFVSKRGNYQLIR